MGAKTPWKVRDKIRDFEKVRQKFDKFGQEKLDQINRDSPVEVEIIFSEPPNVKGVRGKDLYGLTCKTKCGAPKKGPTRIYINTEKIRNEGPEKVTLNEVLAHEGSHLLRGEDWDDDSPKPNEGESYLDSLRMRSNEGVPTGPEWWKAHPEAEKAKDSNFLLNEHYKVRLTPK